MADLSRRLEAVLLSLSQSDIPSVLQLSGRSINQSVYQSINLPIIAPTIHSTSQSRNQMII